VRTDVGSSWNPADLATPHSYQGQSNLSSSLSSRSHNSARKHCSQMMEMLQLSVVVRKEQKNDVAIAVYKIQ